MLNFDDDDLLMGSPKGKFFDILKAANSNLVEQELDFLVQRIAAYEAILVEKGVHEEELDQMAQSYIFEHSDIVQERTNSMYIEIVGNIVTRNE
jgi:hypothetical protein